MSAPTDIGREIDPALLAAVTAGTSPGTDWRAQLEAAVAREPRGIAGMAERMCISRTYISLVLSGKISPVSPRFIARVRACVDTVECPHLQRTLSSPQCSAYAARPYVVITAAEVPHWRACQKCPLKAPALPPPALDHSERQKKRAPRKPNPPKAHAVAITPATPDPAHEVSA